MVVFATVRRVQRQFARFSSRFGPDWLQTFIAGSGPRVEPQRSKSGVGERHIPPRSTGSPGTAWLQGPTA